MTFVSCLAIGIAFVIAVGLLTAAGVVLGWLLPVWIERIRRERDRKRGRPPASS